MDAKTKKFVEETFPAKQPKTYAACYPRRVTPPGGYLNPKYFARVLESQVRYACTSEDALLPHLTGILNAYKQLEYGVRPYFVRSEFAQAVAQTNPPKDFKFSEIKWPLDAMLFVLPTAFALHYFGFDVPFISVCRVPAGMYPDCVKFPEMDMPVWAMHKLRNDSDRFTVMAPCYSDFEAPPYYTANFNLTQNIGAIPDSPFVDATFYEEQVLNLKVLNSPDLPAGEAERAFHDKLIMFAIKLLLTVTARPGLIQNGEMTRKPSVTKSKHPRVVDALWSPCTIGWDYHAPRNLSTPGGGTHSSPRMHWRLGHMHTVLHGPQKSERRLDWFEPILVNAPE